MARHPLGPRQEPAWENPLVLDEQPTLDNRRPSVKLANAGSTIPVRGVGCGSIGMKCIPTRLSWTVTGSNLLSPAEAQLQDAVDQRRSAECPSREASPPVPRHDPHQLRIPCPS